MSLWFVIAILALIGFDLSLLLAGLSWWFERPLALSVNLLSAAINLAVMIFSYSMLRE